MTSINIAAPAGRVFRFWHNPENFQRFTSKVREARCLRGGRRHRVVAAPSPCAVECGSEITRGRRGGGRRRPLGARGRRGRAPAGRLEGKEGEVIFLDRTEAGRRLAARLSDYAGRTDVIVLALPRGGVPVAYEVARALGAPLDIFLVRKIGVPGHEELAMGAIATGGVRVVNEEVVRHLNVPRDVIEAVAAEEGKELERREHAYRGDRAAPGVEGRTVILVDDGLATGSTMRAAATALGRQRPARIVIAVPVSAPQTCDEFRKEVDEVVCAATPEPFGAVGLWYENFSQTSDEEVRDLLERAGRRHDAAPPGQ